MSGKDIPFKKRLALNVFIEFRKTEVSLHELTYLFWEYTHRCNLSCLHCGSDCKPGITTPDMPPEDFLRVTEKIKTQYDPSKVMVVITGGEPLMRKDLEYCGAELAKQGYSWGMVTNGILLSEKRLDSLLNGGLKSVTVSLDGLEASHNWLRNRECFNEVVQAISLLVRTKGIVFDVVTCVNQRNFGELDEMKKMLIPLGVKNWRLFTISPIGRAKDNPEMTLSANQFVELLNFIKETRQENLIRANYECEGFVGNFELEVRDGFFFCRAGINIASVLVDGSISACPNVDRRYSQGNINRDDFLETWNGQFRSMRERDWMKTGICTHCTVFKWCSGNGMHLRDFGSGDVISCQYNLL
jgi:radical SAM enzyme (rSAM/lipoprotein system)